MDLFIGFSAALAAIVSPWVPRGRAGSVSLLPRDSSPPDGSWGL